MSNSSQNVTGTSDATTTGTSPEEPTTAGYESARDVDGDGNIDIIHSINPDGQAEIAHVDDEGNVTLLERDTDGNGTYDTAASLLDDGTIRVASDLDDDGQVDLVSYVDEAGNLVQQDVVEDGIITVSLVDTNADGIPDVQVLDSNKDGIADTVIRDTDHDGIVNDISVDVDGDGLVDVYSVDSDNDGTLESTYTGGETDTDTDTDTDTEPITPDGPAADESIL